MALSIKGDIEALSSEQRQQLVALYFPSDLSSILLLGHKRLSEAQRQHIISSINAAMLQRADFEDTVYQGFDIIDASTLRWLQQLPALPDQQLYYQ